MEKVFIMNSLENIKSLQKPNAIHIAITKLDMNIDETSNVQQWCVVGVNKCIHQILGVQYKS